MSSQNSDVAWWVRNRDGASTSQSMMPTNEDQQSDQVYLSRSQVSPHVMPNPSGAPWNMQNMTWGMPSPQPSVVRFTGTCKQLDTFVTSCTNNLHAKRKSDLQVDIPNKYFISDEKMADHLNGLHISPDYTTHSIVQVNNIPSEPGTSQNQSMELFTNEDLVKRLKSAQKVILCEEMRNIARNEPLLPTTLMQRRNEQRCMSLVLWKPPEKCLSTIEEDDDKNNNEDSDIMSSDNRHSLLSNENVMDIEM